MGFLLAICLWIFFDIIILFFYSYLDGMGKFSLKVWEDSLKDITYSFSFKFERLETQLKKQGWKTWNVTMRWQSYITNKSDKMTTHNKVLWKKEIFELVSRWG
jgi:hypothetical protein